MSKWHYELDSTDLCFLTKIRVDISEDSLSRMIVCLEKKSHEKATDINYNKLLSKYFHHLRRDEAQRKQ